MIHSTWTPQVELTSVNETGIRKVFLHRTTLKGEMHPRVFSSSTTDVDISATAAAAAAEAEVVSNLQNGSSFVVDVDVWIAIRLCS